MNETKRSFWRGILEFITGLNLAIKLITSIIVLAGALMGIFAAVGGFDEPEEKFTLTIYVEGQGTTHPSPGTYKYEEGHQIPITPVPDPGHEFDRWSGDYSGTSSTLSITMDTDKSVTASFKAIPITPVEKFTITIAVAGKGTTSPFPGSHPYDEGQRVTITATPSSDYRFDHWEGNASDTSPSITITMDRDKSVTAYFVAPEPAPAPAPAPAKPAPAPPTPTPNQVVLQTVVNPTGGGTVNPSGGTYDSGPMVYVIATPSPNYQFVSWSGDVPADIRLSPDIWIPTDRDRNVTAHFELIPTPTTGIINVNVTLNGSSWSGPVNYTITGPTQTISGTSTLSYSNLSSGSYTIYYNSGGPGGATLASITPSATQTLTSGGVITFTLNFTTVTTGVPELMIESLTHSPANPTTTDQITFTAVVRNAGTGSAGASTLSFKVGGETTPPTYPVPALAPGATYTVQRQLTLGVAQNYLITVIVDVNNNVAESNEANNQRTDTVSVH